jgi:predicted deacylase
MKRSELYNISSSKVLIIGGQHGDEPIGIDICKKMIDLTHDNDGIHIIPIANRPAYLQKTREFNGINLNRSYGENSTNILELDKMVETIKNIASESMVIIDCHSTPLEGLQEIAVFPNELGKEFASHMGLPFYMLPPPEDSLRFYCDIIEIPVLTFEGIHEYHEESVEAGVAGIMKLLRHLNII